jgi:hypothetical protein
MKTLIKIMPLALVCIFVGCGDNGTQVIREPLICLSPGEVSQRVGTTLYLTVEVRRVEDLFAVSFDLFYDTDVLELIDAQVSDSGLLEPSSAITFFESAEDGASVAVGRTQTPGDDDVSGDGTLLDLTFRSISAGTTTIQFSGIRIIDETGTESPCMESLEATGSTVKIVERGSN